MEALQLFKLALPLLSRQDLLTLQLLVDNQLSPGHLLERVKELWVSDGKIAAVKEYHYYEGHINKPSLKESKDFVETICKGL